ncbi:MAG: hypothetical protein ACJ8CB_01990 [Ktedonobacteraceae bacterium]
MDKQSENQTSTDPGTTSIPPAEGRTDIGEGQGSSQQLPPDQAANATTSTTGQPLSKHPAEGRADVAQDPAQEQKQSYSASTGRAPDHPSTGDTGTAPQAPQGPTPQPED